MLRIFNDIDKHYQYCQMNIHATQLCNRLHLLVCVYTHERAHIHTPTHTLVGRLTAS